MTALLEHRRRLGDAVAPRLRSIREATDRGAPAARRLRDVFAVGTRLGWTLLVLSIVCWVLGAHFGWVEFVLIGAAGLFLVILCGLLCLGRTTLAVGVEVQPERVVVGEPSAGQITTTNTAMRPLLPIGLELPIGDSTARFQLPLLRGGATHEELFVAPTDRRGVVAIGPALTVRGDPLGLLRRTLSWTRVVELFVHPITVPLEPLSAGLLRDLEGQTTNDLSMSDLAFHALREYQPGDDRRYIHWRSSAKAGRFLVRQFLDTRRSHITAIVDADPDSYATAEDFETAISAGASIAVRAVKDEQEITVLAGAHTSSGAAGRAVLDAFSRAELGTGGLAELASRAARQAAGTSIAVLITGSHAGYLDLQRAAAHFPQEVRTVALRVDPSAATGIAGTSSLTVLGLRTLGELPALLAGTLQ